MHNVTGKGRRGPQSIHDANPITPAVIPSLKSLYGFHSISGCNTSGLTVASQKM